MSQAQAMVCVAALLVIAGCRAETAPADVDTSHPEARTSTAEVLVTEGRAAYELYCIGCHGAEGDGAGQAAKFFDPKPRNFQEAYYKFSATRSGQLPTDDDLKRTIREGLRGSAMPPFDLLPERTVNALVAYLKTFSAKWAERQPASAIPFVEDPYRSNEDTGAALQRGEAVYHGFATCWTCHPAYVSQERLNEHIVSFGGHARPSFRAHLGQAVGKDNISGELIYPPDFLRDFVRSGPELSDLYRIIGAGVTGTAMPTWIDSIDFPGESAGDPPLVQPADIWAMAYYVQDLIRQRPDKLTAGRFVVRERPKAIYLHGAPPKKDPADEADDFWDDLEEEEDSPTEGEG